MKLRSLIAFIAFTPCVAAAQPYQSIWDGAQKLDITAGSAAKVDGSAVTQPVSGTLACTQSGTWDEVGINDSGNSITVDYATTGSGTATGALRVELPTNGTGVIATVGAVTAITNALPSGTNGIGKLTANSGVDIGDVDVTSLTGGTVAHDAADSGNPIKVGGKALNAMPTAVANADRSDIGTDLYQRVLTTHIDPAMQVHKNVNFTTTQTGTDVWSPTSGKKIAVTSVIVSSYDTTGCRLLLWFGDNADTTYSAGTDQLLLPFSTVPSATIKPGIVYTPAVPVFCTTADRELHVTTDAACDIDIVVEGYEF